MAIFTVRAKALRNIEVSHPKYGTSHFMIGTLEDRQANFTSIRQALKEKYNIPGPVKDIKFRFKGDFYATV